MKPNMLNALLALGVISSSALATPTQWCSSTQSKTDNVVQSIRLAANNGARCSDGTYCATGYDYCCYINGTETCVKSLSDCKDD